ELLEGECPVSVSRYKSSLGTMAEHLVGSSVSSIEGMLRTFEHRGESVGPETLDKRKKQLVERECNGLSEFIERKRSLNDHYGIESVKAWLRQDLELWKQNDAAALPKGYLLCGPVGTGKTFLVECLAGEAGLPVVKLKNFRDKWVGSTEGNLERI